MYTLQGPPCNTSLNTPFIPPFIHPNPNPNPNPNYTIGMGPIEARLRTVFSFYSLIDLLAILPFYIAEAMPGSWVDQNDEYLRMLRLLRLFKLDKYVPSITLIDDVFRLKKHALTVTGFAAGTLWILFAALLYLCEYQDTAYTGASAVPNLPAAPYVGEVMPCLGIHMN